MGRGIGMEGPYPSLSPSANKGKGRQTSTGGGADAEADLTRRTSNKYYSGSIAAARDDPNGTIGQGDRISLVGGLIRGPSVDLGEGMVGVGRNSIIRNSMIGGVGSPKSGTLLLGPAPNGIPVDRSDRERERDKRPPHLIPQPEICVECMMRDRDMIDVDVTGDGVWERESDAEWEEALRLDSTRDDTGSLGDRGSEEGFANTDSNGRKRRMSSNAGGGEGSRESAGGRSYASGRKKIGRGQPLTVASLKLWTSMVSSSCSLIYLQSVSDTDTSSHSIPLLQLSGGRLYSSSSILSYASSNYSVKLENLHRPKGTVWLDQKFDNPLQALRQSLVCWVLHAVARPLHSCRMVKP